MNKKSVLLLSFITLTFFGMDAQAASLRDEMIAKAKREGALVIAGNVVSDIKKYSKGFHKKPG
ncbi:MAG: hypothetical protein Q8P24_16025 [Desulfobacterales bacterium]|nr:hypothetical protein [Desulfobacterales bacterium]